MSERMQNKNFICQFHIGLYLKSKHTKSAFPYEPMWEFIGNVEEKQVPRELMFEVLIHEKRFVKKIENLREKARESKI